MNDAERVYKYAKRVVDGKPNHHWPWPSIRQAARSLRMRQSEVIDAVEEAGGMGMPCSLVVGMQITGGGYGSYDHEGDYEIEVWGE